MESAIKTIATKADLANLLADLCKGHHVVTKWMVILWTTQMAALGIILELVVKK